MCLFLPVRWVLGDTGFIFLLAFCYKIKRKDTACNDEFFCHFSPPGYDFQKSACFGHDAFYLCFYGLSDENRFPVSGHRCLDIITVSRSFLQEFVTHAYSVYTQNFVVSLMSTQFHTGWTNPTWHSQKLKPAKQRWNNWVKVHTPVTPLHIFVMIFGPTVSIFQNILFVTQLREITSLVFN